MKEVQVIDLNFLNQKQAIAAFLIESSEGPILIETGPETTYPHLIKEIEKLGYKEKDIKHVIVTHVHFDHAGAAWKFAKNGAMVYVHSKGLPHLENPERLWNSAVQIYKNNMEKLWGKMEPIPVDKLVAVEEGDILNIGDVELKIWYTPGHAVHHISVEYGETIIAGDVGGIKIVHGPILPPCPPPDINVVHWKESIQKMKNINAKYICLTHFGKHETPNVILTQLETSLENWANWIKPYYEQQTPTQEIIPKFSEYTQKYFIKEGLTEQQIQIYEYANPSWMSVSGLLRYWKLKEEGRI